MAAVLTGLKVVEFTHMVAGPACGQVLADLGASVVKVEPPQGDVTRRMGPQAGDVAALYASTNRTKDVVCLDVTDPAQAKRAQALAVEADVVISNLAPAMLEAAGLDGRTLRGLNPRLIVVLVTGFGTDNPAGTDGLAQAQMGLVSITGPAEGTGFRTGASVVDVSTGVWAALGVLAALENRRQTGVGDLVNVSLADTCLYMQYPQVCLHDADPPFARRNGNHSTLSCTPMLRASDGRVLVTVLSPKHWRALCRSTGLAHLADDPRFETNEQRCAAQGRIEDLLETATRAQDTRRMDLAAACRRRCRAGPSASTPRCCPTPGFTSAACCFACLKAEGSSLQVRMPLEFETTERSVPRPPPTLPRTSETP
jgi:crotonobetainyl-CoA:carnitine CoA-transferase CaiB-like acyl-CoA transferase